MSQEWQQIRKCKDYAHRQEIILLKKIIPAFISFPSVCLKIVQQTTISDQITYKLQFKIARQPGLSLDFMLERRLCLFFERTGKNIMLWNILEVLGLLVM